MGKSLNIRIFTKKLLIVTVRRNCLATLISSRTKLHTEEYLFQAILVQAYLQKGVHYRFETRRGYYSYQTK